MPCNYRWLGTVIHKSNQICKPQNPERQDVTVWMSVPNSLVNQGLLTYYFVCSGEACAISPNHSVRSLVNLTTTSELIQSPVFIGTLQYGSCVVQPTTISFSSEELVDMVNRCGLNRINQFPTFLASHLRKSRDDPKLLSMLSNLDDVLYSGLPLPREEEDWAYRNGIKLRVSLLLCMPNAEFDAPCRTYSAAQSAGACFFQQGDASVTPHCFGRLTDSHTVSSPPPPLSQNAPTSQRRRCSSSSSSPNHQIVPIPRCAAPMETSIPAISSRRRLLACTYSEAGTMIGSSLRIACAVILSTLRAHPFDADDKWLTWKRRAIEDNVRTVCGNLVAECIVVGSGRPSPIMFIEPAGEQDHDRLKKEIIRKTRHFHSRRYLHERITSTEMIVIVPRQSLPRTATKGNIRRKAVEEAYKTQLDEIYAHVR